MNADVSPDQARSMFPPGTEVVAAEETWSPDGTGMGGVMRVSVTAPGKLTVEYLAVMVKEVDGWKVLATLPVDDASSTVSSS